MEAVYYVIHLSSQPHMRTSYTNFIFCACMSFVYVLFPFSESIMGFDDFEDDVKDNVKR